jgi:hypothetical protein
MLYKFLTFLSVFFTSFVFAADTSDLSQNIKVPGCIVAEKELSTEEISFILDKAFEQKDAETFKQFLNPNNKNIVYIYEFCSNLLSRGLYLHSDWLYEHYIELLRTSSFDISSNWYLALLPIIGYGSSSDLDTLVNRGAIVDDIVTHKLCKDKLDPHVPLGVYTVNSLLSIAVKYENLSCTKWFVDNGAGCDAKFDALRFAFVAKGNDYFNSLIKNASKDEVNKDYKLGLDLVSRNIKEISFLNWCCLVDENFIFDAFCQYTDELNYCTKIKNLLNAGADISSLNNKQKKLLEKKV